MMLDTALSTARIISRLCSPENPSISIKGSSAPRITQSKFGWLRNSSFSRKARFNFDGLFMSRGWFAAIELMPGSPFGIFPGYRLCRDYGKETQFCPGCNEICCAHPKCQQRLDD